MELAKKIEDYYFEHINDLPEDKYFHYLSRLASWNDNPRATKLIAAQKNILLPSREPAEVRNMLNSIINDPPSAKINALTERQPYFDKYPHLRGLSFALFRVRHLLTLFSIDIRNDLLSVISETELHNLTKLLINDPAAVRILSTYAVNYVFLTEEILYFNNGIKIDFKFFIKLGEKYDRKNPTHIQLLIYLYTHCIIGASNYYANYLNDEHKLDALVMLNDLEILIDNNFNNVNLDNKLEFLVCCKIINKTSILENKIYEECDFSISKDGTYVIDTINSNRQSNKTSFSDSEHRNVLYIMSSKDYKPISTRT
jgi:hypothetical protein